MSMNPRPSTPDRSFHCVGRAFGFSERGGACLGGGGGSTGWRISAMALDTDSSSLISAKLADPSPTYANEEILV